MNATTILCILLRSLYLLLAVFRIVRSIIDTMPTVLRSAQIGIVSGIDSYVYASLFESFFERTPFPICGLLTHKLLHNKF